MLYFRFTVKRHIRIGLGALSVIVLMVIAVFGLYALFIAIPEDYIPPNLPPCTRVLKRDCYVWPEDNLPYFLNQYGEPQWVNPKDARAHFWSPLTGFDHLPKEK